jgi:hypothetical protein
VKEAESYRPIRPVPASASARRTASASATGTKTMILSSGSAGAGSSGVTSRRPSASASDSETPSVGASALVCAVYSAQPPLTRPVHDPALGRGRGDPVHAPEQQRVVRDQQLRLRLDRLGDRRGDRVDREHDRAHLVVRVPADQADGVPVLGPAGRVPLL